MFLGALVDVGVPPGVLQDAVDRLGVEEVRLTATEVTRHGLAATKVDVTCPDSTVDRRYAAIVELIMAAPLVQSVRDKAIDAFARLGRAESQAHRVPLHQVHFHEVGALDSLADVVAACTGLQWLVDNRGVSEFAASAVTTGGGVTRGAHGGIPLPAPATLAVLSEAKVPVSGQVGYEACTPTGAALIAAHASSFGPMPTMRVDTVGTGAGGRDPDERANVLRLVLGESMAPAPQALVYETNVDDLDPRLWPQVLSALLDAGAGDAWLTPILMKKGRPAHTLHVLCAADRARTVRAAIFANTSTIGLRARTVDKYALDREPATIEVDGISIGVKVARHEGQVVNVSVEHDDVVAAAASLGQAVKVVLARASAQASERYGTS